MQAVYFDNSATTMPCPAAVEAAERVIRGEWGNPSSLHKMGFEAEKLLKNSRESLMRALFCGRVRTHGVLIFTSCGTEANNLALFGAANAKARSAGGKIICGASEHPSVLNSVAELGRRGFKTAVIPAPAGVIDMNALEAELGADTVIVSVMLVNNETGAVTDVKAISDLIKAKAPAALLHCDAVQGFMKLPFTPDTLGADMLTVSAHKIHGLKGAGALWVSEDILKRKALSPLLFGGGQEGNIRSGTEAMPAIAAFGAAADFCFESFSADSARLEKLGNLIRSGLDSAGIKYKKPATALVAPHIINATLPGIKSETMLHFLSGKSIFVSAGSACAAHSGKPGALVSFGSSDAEIASSVRISAGIFNTEQDAVLLLEALSEGIASLAGRKKRL